MGQDSLPRSSAPSTRREFHARIPAVVVDEFNRRTQTSDLVDRMTSRARSSIQNLGTLAAAAQVDLAVVSAELEAGLVKLEGAVRTLVGAVATIFAHRNSSIIPITDQAKVACFDRLGKGLPPDDRDKLKRSSLNDHLIWLAVLATSEMRTVIFCTNNNSDFAANGDNVETLHDVLFAETSSPGRFTVDFHDLVGFMNAHVDMERDPWVLVEDLPRRCADCGDRTTTFLRQPPRFRQPDIEIMHCRECRRAHLTGAMRPEAS